MQLPPYGHNVLIAGRCGSGKSTVTAGIIERLIEKDHQVCIVDPEGDYGTLRDVAALGNRWRAPSINEVLSILEEPQINLSVNLLGIPLGDRPDFFAQLIPNLQAMRTRTGRPHWLVPDEAHHLLPETWGHAALALPQRLGETILVTVHPDHVTPAVLALIDIVVGHRPLARGNAGLAAGVVLPAGSCRRVVCAKQPAAFRHAAQAGAGGAHPSSPQVRARQPALAQFLFP